MEQFYYLGVLLVSITCLGAVDYRYELAFWHDKVRTAKTVLVSMLVFIFWDIVGIGLGVFFHGQSQYALPVRLLPEFPIEELFFLFLLCYTTLLLYRFGVKKWPRT